jgi:hypothetical protein
MIPTLKQRKKVSKLKKILQGKGALKRGLILKEVLGVAPGFLAKNRVF